MIINYFKEYCKTIGYNFENIESVKSYREDTLFCIAGMQKYYDYFTENKQSIFESPICNNQAVLRMNDENEIGDGSHFLYFNMLGYFDFRKDNVKNRLNHCFYFWHNFLLWLRLKNTCTDNPNDNIYLTYKLHPYIVENNLSPFLNIELNVEQDNTLIWQEGDLIGYSIEFYINDIEVGNIVLYKNGMIDCGFGAERLEMFCDKNIYFDGTKTIACGDHGDLYLAKDFSRNKKLSKNDIIIQTCEALCKSGIEPSNVKQGYVLRKLLTVLVKEYYCKNLYFISHNKLLHQYYMEEIERFNKNIEKYNKLKDKHKDKSKEWWWDTHGVDINLLLD